jgi:hypothetical protein
MTPYFMHSVTHIIRVDNTRKHLST